MFKNIAVILIVLIGALLIYAATKPDMFRVQRSASINASADKLFPFINDFHNWAPWSPYEKKDLAMKKSHSGAASGVGAVYAWEGNKEVGRGNVAITESLPPFKVAMDLNMIEPFEAHNRVEFTLEPHGNATTVTWAMNGPQPYVGKLMSVFMDCDKMIGKDFEAGLANLKTVAEK
jgi:hypothetical protein